MDLSEARRFLLLDRARNAIRDALGMPIAVNPAATEDPQLLAPGGCFVSLHTLSSHRLRGCVGRLDTRQSILNVVDYCARAVLDDPRFAQDRVHPDALPDLDIEITLTSAMTLANDTLAFDLQVHGIFLTVGERCGCFLPQVARQTGWPRELLLARLCTEKLELPQDAWRGPEAQLQTFTVAILGPVPFEQATARL